MRGFNMQFEGSDQELNEELLIESNDKELLIENDDDLFSGIKNEQTSLKGKLIRAYIDRVSEEKIFSEELINGINGKTFSVEIVKNTVELVFKDMKEKLFEKIGALQSNKKYNLEQQAAIKIFHEKQTKQENLELDLTENLNLIGTFDNAWETASFKGLRKGLVGRKLGLSWVIQDIVTEKEGVNTLSRQAHAIISASIMILNQKIKEETHKEENEKNDAKIAAFQAAINYIFGRANFDHAASKIHMALLAPEIIENIEDLYNPDVHDKQKALENNAILSKSLLNSSPMAAHVLTALGIGAGFGAAYGAIVFPAFILGSITIGTMPAWLFCLIPVASVTAFVSIVSLVFSLTIEYQKNAPARQMVKFGIFPEAAENKSDAKTVNDFNVNSNYVF